VIVVPLGPGIAWATSPGSGISGRPPPQRQVAFNIENRYRIPYSI
jgi:hypothetical protein